MREWIERRDGIYRVRHEVQLNQPFPHKSHVLFAVRSNRDHVPGSVMMADTSPNAPRIDSGASECRREAARFAKSGQEK
jgi:hypothetical protein